MDVDALYYLDFEARGVYVLDVGLYFLFGPHVSGGLVEQSHEAGAARYLLYVFKRNGVGALSVPSECHFHG